MRRWLAALALALGCGCSPQKPPNVLLVTVDTLRADHTSLHGYARDTTPALRDLAAQGAHFERAYAPSATTAPSHATLFTGLYPIAHRVVKNGLPLAADDATLAERLRDAGYQTVGVVSSFVLDEKFGFGRGFEVYRDDFYAESSTLRLREWEGFELAGAFDRRGDATTDFAIAWLAEGRDPTRPFLLFVHYFDPHDPYVPPPPWDARFTADPSLPEALGDEVRRYDGEIGFADREIGRLLLALAREGLAGDTLVVATADHGEGLMTHGRMRHGADLHEESVRVPLVVRWPGRIAPGLALASPVELVDVAPTVLDLVGLEGQGLQGRSLAPALRGDATLDPARPVFLHRRPYAGDAPGIAPGDLGEQFAVRRGRWKYVEGVDRQPRALYDLERDPGERIDRYASAPEEAAPQVERLARELADWRRRFARGGDVAPLSPEDRRRLEALGYTE